MSELAKGGRGKRAPYETSMVRTPVPLKPLFEEITANYRELVELSPDPNAPGLVDAALSAVAHNQLEDRPADADETSTIILDAIAEFIKIQQQEYGKNPAQRNKKFSMDSRGWDMLKKFTTWVNSQATLS